MRTFVGLLHRIKKRGDTSGASVGPDGLSRPSDPEAVPHELPEEGVARHGIDTSASDGQAQCFVDELVHRLRAARGSRLCGLSRALIF